MPVTAIHSWWNRWSSHVPIAQPMTHPAGIARASWIIDSALTRSLTPRLFLFGSSAIARPLHHVEGVDRTAPIYWIVSVTIAKDKQCTNRNLKKISTTDRKSVV